MSIKQKKQSIKARVTKRLTTPRKGNEGGQPKGHQIGHLQFADTYYLCANKGKAVQCSDVPPAVDGSQRTKRASSQNFLWTIRAMESRACVRIQHAMHPYRSLRGGCKYDGVKIHACSHHDCCVDSDFLTKSHEWRLEDENGRSLSREHMLGGVPFRLVNGACDATQRDTNDGPDSSSCRTTSRTSTTRCMSVDSTCSDSRKLLSSKSANDVYLVVDPVSSRLVLQPTLPQFLWSFHATEEQSIENVRVRSVSYTGGGARTRTNRNHYQNWGSPHVMEGNSVNMNSVKRHDPLAHSPERHEAFVTAPEAKKRKHKNSITRLLSPKLLSSSKRSPQKNELTELSLKQEITELQRLASEKTVLTQQLIEKQALNEKLFQLATQNAALQNQLAADNQSMNSELMRLASENKRLERRLIMDRQRGNSTFQQLASKKKELQQKLGELGDSDSQPSKPPMLEQLIAENERLAQEKTKTFSEKAALEQLLSERTRQLSEKMRMEQELTFERNELQSRLRSAEQIRWVPDDDRNACILCDRVFHFFFRRHHCRCCGDIFCDDCAPIDKGLGCRSCEVCQENNGRIAPVAPVKRADTRTDCPANTRTKGAVYDQMATGERARCEGSMFLAFVTNSRRHRVSLNIHKDAD